MDERMKQVKLYGLGTLNNGRGMAMLLIETEGERLFPVFVPDYCRAYYSEMIRRSLSGSHHISLLDHFSRAIGMEIRRVSIHISTDDTISTSIDVISEYGGGMSFDAPMHQSVFYAFMHQLPIYIDSHLLAKMNGRVYIQEFQDESVADEDTTRQFLSKSKIGEYFRDQIRPDQADEPIFLERYTDLELSILLEMSVASESYEWSKVLSDEQRRRRNMMSANPNNEA